MQSDRLPVNEIFETLQGEAGFTGTPSVFVRLQGCPVGCAWCDTKHTWNATDMFYSGTLPMIQRKTAEPSRTFALVEVDELIATVVAYKSRHVVITGGEPCLYDLEPLAARLGLHKKVQVETSGTEEIRVIPNTWVTVSPKFDMPGGREVRLDALRRADEIKFPVGKLGDIEKLLTQVVPHLRKGVQIWLQPLSQSPKATALCIEQATLNGWRVSLQTHKFIGLR